MVSWLLRRSINSNNSKESNLLRVNASLITTIGTDIKKDKASFIPSFRGAHAEAVEDKEAEIARPQFLEVSPDRKDADIHSVFAQANPSINFSYLDYLQR